MVGTTASAVPRQIMKVGQHSHPGRARSVNEDAFGWFSTENGELCAVADGMGGMTGGGAAAQTAIDTLKGFFEKTRGLSIPDLLYQGIMQANSRVIENGRSGLSSKRMGTTLVVLVVKDRLAYIAHVGDSRLYLFRNGHITRLTRDHSVVQRMIDQGLITEQEAESHPDAHVITQCVGCYEEVEVEVRPAPVLCLPGDVFLLCTDGLSSLVTDNEMAEVLSGDEATVERSCRRLVDLALERGGHDNITVQIVSFEGIPRVPRAAPDTYEDDGPELGDSWQARAARAKAALKGWKSFRPRDWLVLFAVAAALFFATNVTWLWLSGSGPEVIKQITGFWGKDGGKVEQQVVESPIGHEKDPNPNSAVGQTPQEMEHPTPPAASDSRTVKEKGQPPQSESKIAEHGDPAEQLDPHNTSRNDTAPKKAGTSTSQKSLPAHRLKTTSPVAGDNSEPEPDKRGAKP